jgi:hypothetical protein
VTSLEALMGERLGQACLHVPSARFGLLLALRHWFRPGDRVLIAPTNCETVLFAALAAGLTPVMAPVSARDGNIDAGRVDWTGLAGVLTTHLYGVPDRVAELRAACDRRGLVLVDDAAHAFQTEVDGRRAGLWGEAGVFSLAKHGRAMSGGFLTTADEQALPELAADRDALLLPGTARKQATAVLRPLLREAVHRTGLVRPVWHALQRVGLMTWTGHRYPATAEEVAKAAGDLEAMDPYLRIDQDDWRMRPGRALLRLQRSRSAPRTGSGSAGSPGWRRCVPPRGPRRASRRRRCGRCCGCRCWSRSATGWCPRWRRTGWCRASCTTRRSTTTCP